MKRAPVLVLAVLLCSFSLFADVRLQPSRLDTAGLRAIGDFNGDGLDDVLNHNQLHFNLGGRFAPAIEVSNIPPRGTALVAVRDVANLNGDPFADVVVYNEGGSDYLLIGSGSGTFSEQTLSGDHGIIVEAFDFTGDGLSDLIQWKPGQLTLKRNLGNAAFAVHQTFAWGDSYTHMKTLPAADVNGDGRLDFIMSEERALVFYLAQADGTFARRERFTRTRPSYILTGDLNGDGHLDVFFASIVHDEKTFTVLFGDGTGRFPSFSRLASHSGSAYKQADTKGVVIGDFVAGGVQEIAYGRHAGEVLVLSAAGNQLREVGRAQVEGQGLGATKMRFRSSVPELMAFGHIRYNANLAAWHVAVDGTAEAAAQQQRSRGRAMGRTFPAVNSGTYRLDVRSECPVSGLTEWTFEREGIFVEFTPDAVVQSAKAVSFPLGIYAELQVKDGATTRELQGWLTPTTEGLTGTLFEYKPACGGRYVTHKITAIPTH